MIGRADENTFCYTVFVIAHAARGQLGNEMQVSSSVGSILRANVSSTSS